jgi:type IV secretory pathway VirB10-like protein
MVRTIAIAALIFATASAFAGSAHAAPLQKPNEVQGHCSGDDMYFAPNDKGAYACLKKDGSGIVCGGATDELKKTCETWSANGALPARAPDKLREAVKKKADKAAADKASSGKAPPDKAPSDKAAADKAAADKAAADKAAAAKAAAAKAAADKAAADKAAAAKAAALHECAGVKLTCGSWAAKDKNTCRTCQQALCKTENGKDVLGGNKSQTQCYDGHGPPPSDLK